jgi:predicted phage terminase large subunit-like protein
MKPKNTKEQRQYEDWLAQCRFIQQQTENSRPVDESPAERGARIAQLSASFEAFAKYYFPHYIRGEFGWFHKEAAKKITDNKNCFAVLEWAREHAKSVFAVVLMPLFLKARGELTGMVLASSNEVKARGLLADLQAELENNALYIEDFGEQMSYGNWQEQHFITKDGVGFWAFGRGQSPRGIRVGEKRPNLAVIDDIDDKMLVKNPARVQETVNWIKEDLVGALAISGSRVIVAGNRIHKASTLAYLVGDIEANDPKNKGIIHIKVYAFEKGAKHEKAMPDEKGARPAWQYHKAADLIARMEMIGHRAAMREYFHEHSEQGLIFQDEWIQWKPPLSLEKYDGIVIYCDPSFKDTAKSDYKAIVAVGKIGLQYHILQAWVRQASVGAMVDSFYDFHEVFGKKAYYYMEANMLQDLLLKDFDTEAQNRGYHVPLRADKEKKENKAMRIENLSPLFERGHIFFSSEQRGSADMQNLKQQLLGFGDASMKDDAPDALEGAISKLNKKFTNTNKSRRVGKYNQKTR